LLVPWWLATVEVESPGSSVENVSDRGRRIRHQRRPGLLFVREIRISESGSRGFGLLSRVERALDHGFGDLTHREPTVH
jgi:hypothetical protein